jgi:hypothetical protein
MRRIRTFLLLALLGTSLHLFAQDRCAYEPYQKILLQRNPARSQEKFENWLQQKLRERTLSGPQNRVQAGPYQVPVVVHVIHNGEAIGTGTNISDSQVLSQIKVLNADYQRLNADAANTPSLFQSVAAGIDLEFVLAKQDPEGLPTNGIVRVRGTKTSWTTLQDEFVYKALSYWPAENYLNIWVLKLADSYIGFAQFPISNLPGLDGQPTDRVTDGVVIDYRAFGSIDDGNFELDAQFNKGRTATHEIGHFFGLLHTFEGGCTGQNDYVADTPSLSEATRNCPSHPASSCNGTKMFQNYLDYTDDVCMNLFTSGQISRMTIVLENSPRRKSLLSSPGLMTPVMLALDAEARRTISPEPKTCGQSLIPKLEVRNRGNSTITSLQVAFRLNGVLTETKIFSTNIPPLQSDTLLFSAISLAEPSNNQVSFSILTTNGTTDNKASNNQITSSAEVRIRTNPPIIETFNSIPSNWSISNPDNGTTWTLTTAPSASSTNSAIFMDLFDYEQEGVKDQLVSPFINLTASESAVLKFDRSYARFQSKNNDSLRVLLYQNCQTDPATAITLFKAGGAALSTSNSTSSYFQPTSQSEWKTEVISLAPYLGGNIQLVFESTNGYGNNLYLDNIQVVTSAQYDLAITKVNGPSPVICKDQPKPVVTIQNLGSASVSKVSITPVINGVTATTQVKTISVPSGTEKQLTLNPITLTAGTNQVQFIISNPDATDEIPDNNSLTATWIVESTVEAIPLRQKFEDMNGWTLYAVSEAENFSRTVTNFDQSLVYPSYTNASKGDEAWLVSPVLDFSKVDKASVFFDLSYGKRTSGAERLRVVASTNCGIDFSTLLYDQSGDLLAIQNANGDWKPVTSGHWKTEFIDLSGFVGEREARLAFVVTNDNGNNLYLDNIEFFEDNNPSPPRISDLYSVYYSEVSSKDFKITFNLPEKQTTRLQVFTIMGQLVLDQSLPETLNQTYTVDLAGQSTGIYIARLQVGNELRSFKMFVGN